MKFLLEAFRPYWMLVMKIGLRLRRECGWSYSLWTRKDWKND